MQERLREQIPVPLRHWTAVVKPLVLGNRWYLSFGKPFDSATSMLIRCLVSVKRVPSQYNRNYKRKEEEKVIQCTLEKKIIVMRDRFKDGCIPQSWNSETFASDEGMQDPKKSETGFLDYLRKWQYSPRDCHRLWGGRISRNHAFPLAYLWECLPTNILHPINSFNPLSHPDTHTTSRAPCEITSRNVGLRPQSALQWMVSLRD